MEQLKEMLEEALPLLKKFNQWQESESEKERIRQETESQSEKEFKAWLEQRKKDEAQQEKDSELLKKYMI